LILLQIIKTLINIGGVRTPDYNDNDNNDDDNYDNISIMMIPICKNNTALRNIRQLFCLNNDNNDNDNDDDDDDGDDDDTNATRYKEVVGNRKLAKIFVVLTAVCELFYKLV